MTKLAQTVLTGAILALAFSFALNWLAAPYMGGGESAFAPATAWAQTPDDEPQLRANEIVSIPDEGPVVPVQYADTVGGDAAQQIHAENERIISREVDACKRNDFLYAAHQYSRQNRAWRYMNCRIANVIRASAVVLAGLALVGVGFSALSMLYQGPENSTTARLNLIVILVSLGVGILAYAVAGIFHITIEPFNFR